MEYLVTLAYTFYKKNMHTTVCVDYYEHSQPLCDLKEKAEEELKKLYPDAFDIYIVYIFKNQHMTTLTQENYYEDKTHISNSMLSDFVTYDDYGTRIYTPDYFYAKHVARTIPDEKSDAMLRWTIIDRAFTEWMHTLLEYPVVARRSWENPNEITNSMHQDIQTILQAIKWFKRLNEFKAHPDTKTQDILTSEIAWVPVKWKTDFKNAILKAIVDLKTTWDILKIWKDMQFKWTPMITARYIRQLALYRFMSGQDYTCAIAGIDDSGKPMWIPVRNDILDAAMVLVAEDIVKLNDYIKSWYEWNEDPFLPLKKETSDEVQL